MVARERASERCFAAWRRRSPPRTMVNVCQPHVLRVRSRPCHRVAHSAHLRKLHSTSCHLRFDGRDLTEYIMKSFFFHCIREGGCSGLHRGTLLLGMDYDTVLTTVVIYKEKTNELIDNIFTVGVKRFRFGPCQPSCCGTSGCVS